MSAPLCGVEAFWYHVPHARCTGGGSRILSAAREKRQLSGERRKGAGPEAHRGAAQRSAIAEQEAASWESKQQADEERQSGATEKQRAAGWKTKQQASDKAPPSTKRPKPQKPKKAKP